MVSLRKTNRHIINKCPRSENKSKKRNYKRIIVYIIGKIFRWDFVYIIHGNMIDFDILDILDIVLVVFNLYLNVFYFISIL